MDHIQYMVKRIFTMVKKTSSIRLQTAVRVDKKSSPSNSLSVRERISYQPKNVPHGHSQYARDEKKSERVDKKSSSPSPLTVRERISYQPKNVPHGHSSYAREFESAVREKNLLPEKVHLYRDTRTQHLHYPPSNYSKNWDFS